MEDCSNSGNKRRHRSSSNSRNKLPRNSRRACPPGLLRRRHSGVRSRRSRTRGGTTVNANRNPGRTRVSLISSTRNPARHSGSKAATLPRGCSRRSAEVQSPRRNNGALLKTALTEAPPTRARMSRTTASRTDNKSRFLKRSTPEATSLWITGTSPRNNNSTETTHPSDSAREILRF